MSTPKFNRPRVPTHYYIWFEPPDDAGDEILHERALHAPEGARLLGLIGRLDRDAVLGDVVADLVAHLQRERALGALDGENLAFGGRADARRQRHRPFADATWNSHHGGQWQCLRWLCGRDSSRYSHRDRA